MVDPHAPAQPLDGKHDVVCQREHELLRQTVPQIDLGGIDNRLGEREQLGRRLAQELDVIGDVVTVLHHKALLDEVAVDLIAGIRLVADALARHDHLDARLDHEHDVVVDALEYVHVAPPFNLSSPADRYEKTQVHSRGTWVMPAIP